MTRYDFTSDWFTARIPNWEQWLVGLIGKPDIRLVEIGSHEGRSAVWTLQTVCTHPSAVLTCLDIWWNPESEKRFDANIAASGQSNQLRKIKGPSYRTLNQIAPKSCDLVYVDGSHEGHNVLLDALLAMEVLKVGGLIILDDYPWENDRVHYPPRPAIDAFLKLADYRLDVIDVEWQVAARKIV